MLTICCSLVILLTFSSAQAKCWTIERANNNNGCFEVEIRGKRNCDPSIRVIFYTSVGDAADISPQGYIINDRMGVLKGKTHKVNFCFERSRVSRFQDFKKYVKSVLDMSYGWRCEVQIDGRKIKSWSFNP